MRRMPSVRPALSRSAAHEVDDFDAVPVGHDSLLVAGALHNGKIVLDSDAARIDIEPLQQRRESQRFLQLVRFAVQSDRQILFEDGGEALG
jgi:hypothetical protein